MPKYTYDVFVSYNSKEREFAELLVQELFDRGVKVWVDYINLRPGDRYPETLRTAMNASKGVVVLVGELLGKFQEIETDLAEIQRKRSTLRVVPIMTPAYKSGPDDLPGFLPRLSSLDMRKGISPEGLDHLVPLLKRTSPPPKPTMCIGRAREVARLETLITTPPGHVAVVGGPGMGKSTVCREVLHRESVRDRYATDDDRRFLVEHCERALSLEPLVGMVAETLGVQHTASMRPMSALRLRISVSDLLSEAPSVLVLDGLESAWDSDGKQVERWLEELSDIPNLAIVCAVRRDRGPLNWPEVFIRPLESSSDASEVFLRAAGHYQDVFRVDPKLDGLVRRLGGMPLALVLFASASASYGSLTTVVSRLGQSKGLGPESKLDDSIAFSMSTPLMTGDSWRLLNLLALLPDGIDFHVLPPHFRALDRPVAIEPLLKLLLGSFSGDRLQTLAPIRESLMRQGRTVKLHASLESSKDDLIFQLDEDVRLLSEHYVSLARRFPKLSPTDADATAARTRVFERGNLEQMLMMALESETPLAAIGVVIELADSISRSGLGMTHVLEKARDVALVNDRQLEMAHCLRCLGDIANLRGEYTAALQYYTEALSRYRNLTNTGLFKVFCILGRAGIEIIRSTFAESLNSLVEAEALIKAECQENSREATVVMAEVKKRRGDIWQQNQQQFEEAAEAYQEARKLYIMARSTENWNSTRQGEANCMQGLADCYLGTYRPDAADASFRNARNIYREIDDLLGKANCTKGLGDVAVQKHEYLEAERHFSEAEKDYQSLGNTLCLANLDKARGEISLANKNYDDAEKRFMSALPNYKKSHNRAGEAYCAKAVGDLYLSQERFDDAWEWYERAADLLETDSAIMVLACRKGQGDVALRRGEYDVARERYLSLLENLENLKDDFAIVQCLIALGEAELGCGAGFLDAASQHLISAEAMLARNFASDYQARERVRRLLSRWSAMKTTSGSGA